MNTKVYPWEKYIWDVGVKCNIAGGGCSMGFNLIKLSILTRIAFRLLSLAYPLFMTVTYNLWLFEGLPGWAFWSYIAFMAGFEAFLLVLPSSSSIWPTFIVTYLVVALLFEFPSTVFETSMPVLAHFAPWLVIWYAPLFMILIAAYREKTVRGNLKESGGSGYAL
ncbi:hypothetical protein [Palaeococcus sp. (in: euryarchaeotes)]